MIEPYINLSLGANNSTVYWFKQLLDWAIDNNISKDSKKSDDSNTTEVKEYFGELRRTKFTDTLYDVALSIPEAKQVEFEYEESTDTKWYGLFKGGSVYKDFIGTIDTKHKSVNQSLGWVIPITTNPLYGLFTNAADNIEYIIALSNFEQKKIVKDFTPLYDLLRSNYNSRRTNGGDVNDTKNLSSWLTTISNSLNRFYLVNNPNGTKIRDSIYLMWKAYMNALTEYNEILALIDYYKNIGSDKIYEYYDKKLLDQKLTKSDNSSYYFTAVDQIAAGYKAKNSGILNEVQAVIYSLVDSDKDQIDDSTTNAFDLLMCFQQPESISYTAAASYESSSPRGSQIPFQFYQQANQIDLSFTLKWHISELANFDTGQITLSEIAKIAEDFTRPWEKGNSIKPKLCHVILPSIAETGYISSAAITYTGSMVGDLFNENSGSGVVSVDSDGNYIRKTDALSGSSMYGYDQLEITFSLIVVKDIKLQRSSDTGNKTVLEDSEQVNLETVAPGARITKRDLSVSDVIKAANATATAAFNLGQALVRQTQLAADFTNLAFGTNI